MDLALVLALVAGGYAVELYSATLGTLGKQDEHGSHLGFEAYHHAESRVLRKPA
jgi:predicted deacetylase